MKNSILFFIGVILTFLLGAFLGSFTGDPIVALAAGLLFAGLSIYRTYRDDALEHSLLESIDITALATALGAYHQEHRDELSTEVLLDEDFTRDMEVWDDVTDEVPLPSLSLTSIVQPGADKTFNPKNNALKFAARKLKVRDCKVDLLLTPSLLEKTWLGKMKSAKDPMELPFEKFIFDYINSKIKEDMRLNAIYRGIYNAAGTGPIDTMTGFLKKITDEITALGIVPVVTGAITAANVVDKIEMTYDALGEAYKQKPSVMKVNPTIFTWYARKYRLDFGGNQDYAGMPKDRRRTVIDGTNCELVAEPGLGSSQRVGVTPTENIVYGCDSASGYNVDVQKFDRQLKVLIDFKAGVEYKQIHARALAVNDQV